MNREGKLSLITFINLREMKSTNKKEIQSLVNSQKENFFQKFIILFSNFEGSKKFTINMQLYNILYINTYTLIIFLFPLSPSLSVNCTKEAFLCGSC